MEKDELFDEAQRLLEQGIQDPVPLFDNWDDLDCLSSGTRVEDIFVDPDSIIVRGTTFSGVGEVSVELSYGGGRDETLLGDSFPIKFYGEMGDGNTVTIKSVIVDTGSFYR